MTRGWYRRLIIGITGLLAGALALPIGAFALSDDPSAAGVVRGSYWHLRTTMSGGSSAYLFRYGYSTDHPLMGDWNGDGTYTPGVFRNGSWLLRNQLTSGAVEHTISFGRPGDIPVIGDWDGDGDTDLAVFRAGRWYFDIGLTGGNPERSLKYGQPTDTPVAGDWNGVTDGGSADLPGLRRGSYWYLDTSATPDGHHDVAFSFGKLASDRPVAGRWQSGPGIDQVGVVRSGTWFLRNSYSSGDANTSFTYGKQADDFFLTWKRGAQSLSQPHRHYTYTVGTKGAVSNSIEEFADIARETLNDQRGWSLGRSIRYSRVGSTGSASFRLWLATPDQVAAADPICDREWSCRVGRDIYVNTERYNKGTTTWSSRPLREYRQYIINHEVGHWLGLPHLGCPGTGQPAPVMMQQSISLGGCKINLWPTAYERNRVYDARVR